MATGDVTVFDEAKAKMIEGDWGSTDQFNVGIIDATVTPTANFATPIWTDFSTTGEVTNAGTYTTGGLSMGTLTTLVTEDAGTMTFDSLEADPTWAQHGSNATDATWGIIYNTVGGDAIAFVELGTVNMSTGALTISWHTSGIFSIT